MLTEFFLDLIPILKFFECKFEFIFIKLMNKIKKKIIIGFSIGDYNGIGPEILLKSFHKSDLFKQCVPVIFCDEEILNFYSNKLNIKISVRGY